VAVVFIPLLDEIQQTAFVACLGNVIVWACQDATFQGEGFGFGGFYLTYPLAMRAKGADIDLPAVLYFLNAHA
jgi:hypothetical protein